MTLTADWRRFILIAAFGLVAMNVFDIYLTQMLLAGTGSHEGNPFMAPFADTNWGLVIKIALPMAVAISHLAGRDHTAAKSWGPELDIRRRGILLGFIVTAYMLIVTWNLHLVRVRLL